MNLLKWAASIIFLLFLNSCTNTEGDLARSMDDLVGENNIGFYKGGSAPVYKGIFCRRDDKLNNLYVKNGVFYEGDKKADVEIVRIEKEEGKYASIEKCEKFPFVESGAIVVFSPKFIYVVNYDTGAKMKLPRDTRCYPN